MYITCVCLFSALSRKVGALQISIIVIISSSICVHAKNPSLDTQEHNTPW